MPNSVIRTLQQLNLQLLAVVFVPKQFQEKNAEGKLFWEHDSVEDAPRSPGKSFHSFIVMMNDKWWNEEF